MESTPKAAFSSTSPKLFVSEKIAALQNKVIHAQFSPNQENSTPKNATPKLSVSEKMAALQAKLANNTTPPSTAPIKKPCSVPSKPLQRRKPSGDITPTNTTPHLVTPKLSEKMAALQSKIGHVTPPQPLADEARSVPARAFQRRSSADVTPKSSTTPIKTTTPRRQISNNKEPVQKKIEHIPLTLPQAPGPPDNKRNLPAQINLHRRASADTTPKGYTTPTVNRSGTPRVSDKIASLQAKIGHLITPPRLDSQKDARKKDAQNKDGYTMEGDRRQETRQDSFGYCRRQEGRQDTTEPSHVACNLSEMDSKINSLPVERDATPTGDGAEGGGKEDPSGGSSFNSEPLHIGAHLDSESEPLKEKDGHFIHRTLNRPRLPQGRGIDSKIKKFEF
eukprot:Platyproteum_vivax@DN8758_c0_g1_i1.p1